MPPIVPKITIVTLFPEMFPGPLAHSVVGRGLKEGQWLLGTINIRTFSTDKHQTVDDTPYGGGAGMVMRADVVAKALRAAKKENPEAKVIYLSPSGHKFTQNKARELGEHGNLILLCGHYEGIDQRVIDAEVDEELSIGDYVLSGGETAAMVVVDAVARTWPGVLGKSESLAEESFDIHDAEGHQLVEYPHYTRPEEWEGAKVPDVLKSGHHGQINAWRHAQAIARTKTRRPDLLQPSNPIKTPKK